MDVIIGMQFGIRHTSSACMFKNDKPEECKEFKIMFNTKSNTYCRRMSQTAPTVALFDQTGTIQSYGFMAEFQNKQLDNAGNHLLFREFIWDLFCLEETVPKNLIAVNGKQMRSIDVVTAILDHIIRRIKTKLRLRSLSSEVKYVLTLPTCACKDSMAFMRVAAMMAGCSSINIWIVEEPKAVLQFCLHNKQKEGIDDRSSSKFVVVECEENNATISVLHLINENTMEIVFKNNTEIWKGCHVLNDFVEMISLEARKTLVDFFEKYPLEYYEFLHEVKSKIKQISANRSRLNIHISSAMLEETRCSDELHESVVRTGRKADLEIKGNKCVVQPEQFKILFTEAGRRIVDYIEKQLFAEFSDINQIILVGEFAQSPILQNIIKTAFSAKNIIIPKEANMPAVRGAVLFGLRSKAMERNIFPNMQHTPLNHAQVALSKERGLRKIMTDDKKPNPSESEESSPQKLCVLL